MPGPCASGWAEPGYPALGAGGGARAEAGDARWAAPLRRGPPGSGRARLRVGPPRLSSSQPGAGPAWFAGTGGEAGPPLPLLAPARGHYGAPSPASSLSHDPPLQQPSPPTPGLRVHGGGPTSPGAGPLAPQPRTSAPPRHRLSPVLWGFLATSLTLIRHLEPSRPAAPSGATDCRPICGFSLGPRGRPSALAACRTLRLRSSAAAPSLSICKCSVPGVSTSCRNPSSRCLPSPSIREHTGSRPTPGDVLEGMCGAQPAPTLSQPGQFLDLRPSLPPKP